MDWAKTTAREHKKHLNFEIWCDLYLRFYGNGIQAQSYNPFDNQSDWHRYANRLSGITLY